MKESEKKLVSFLFNDKIEHLYIHIPFCKQKCEYCAFYSVSPSPQNSVESFFTHLKNEILAVKSEIGELKSIYIGGGTPNILLPSEFKKLFSLISNNFKISSNAEITIECNPDLFTNEKISILSQFVNRVSIGIQSFSEPHRRIIGRKASTSNIEQVVSQLYQNNISNISCDLIYAIPNQTIEDFVCDLETYFLLNFKHISLYSLTYEEGTTLTKKMKHNENDFNEISAKMWSIAEKLLSSKNIKRYEVSNYAVQGFECKHNLNTWFGGRLIGIGPTASSFNGKYRYTNQEINGWASGETPDIDEIPLIERFIEIFAMGLRTSYPWIFKIRNNKKIEMKSSHSDFVCKISRELFLSFLSKLNELDKNYQFIKIEPPNKVKNKYLATSNKNNNFTEMILSEIAANKQHYDAIFVSSTEKGKLFWDTLFMELMEISENN